MSFEHGASESIAPNIDSLGGNPHYESPSRKRREYLRTYQNRWMARRRAEFLAGKGCAFCGSSERLEVDHIDPAQKTEHKIWSWSDERRAAELAKCRILCHDCHVKRHADDRRKPLVHGTANAYAKKRCRCAECRAWNAARVTRRRAALAPTPEAAR